MECSGLTTTVNRRLLCETITLKRCCQIPSPDDSESSSDKDCEEQGDDYPTGCDETEAVSTMNHVGLVVKLERRVGDSWKGHDIVRARKGRRNAREGINVLRYCNFQSCIGHKTPSCVRLTIRYSSIISSILCCSHFQVSDICLRLSDVEITVSAASLPRYIIALFLQVHKVPGYSIKCGGNRCLLGRDDGHISAPFSNEAPSDVFSL